MSGTALSSKTELAAAGWQRGLTFFFFAVAFGTLVVFFKGEKGTEILPASRTMEAFLEMSAATELEKKNGAIYTDRSAGAFLKPDQPIAFYESIFKEEKIEPTKALVINPKVFQEQTAPFSETKGEAFVDKLMSSVVLRGLIIDATQGQSYYFLMPMHAEEPLLITLLDQGGVKRQWQGSYKQAFAFDHFPSGGHYLMMTKAEHREMMRQMPTIQGIEVLLTREGHKSLPDVHLLQVKSLITFAKVPKGMVILPLKEGW